MNRNKRIVLAISAAAVAMALTAFSFPRNNVSRGSNIFIQKADKFDGSWAWTNNFGGFTELLSVTVNITPSAADTVTGEVDQRDASGANQEEIFMNISGTAQTFKWVSDGPGAVVVGDNDEVNIAATGTGHVYLVYRTR